MIWRRYLVGVLLGGMLACAVGINASAQGEEEGRPVADEGARGAEARTESPPPPGEAPVFTPYPYMVIVTGSAVNIRSGPSTRERVIGRVVRNDLLEAIGEAHGWLHVVVPSGTVGYIYGELTAKPPSPVPADVEAAVGEHLRQGNIHYYREDFDEAVDEYRAALDAWPENPEAHYNLAGAYAEKGWYEEAVNEYAEALGLNPDHVYSFYNLGCVYFQQGRYQEASAQWERVVKMRPWFLDALYNLALAYEMVGDPRTEEVWRRFIEAAEKAGELEEVVEQTKARLAAAPAE